MNVVGGYRVVLLGAMLIVIGAGCASTGTWNAPDGVQTLMPGWERFFTLDWQPGERKGRAIVSGRIENTYVPLARNVQLLVEGLDEQGKVVKREVIPLTGDILRSESRYFEVPVQKLANYRVSLFAYDWVRLDCG